jgi:glutamyl-tRNA synthetase
MQWDELYYQGERFHIYQEYAEKLLDEKKAYRAENGAIIFKVEPEKIKINDLIRGEIEFDTETIKDQVLIKEDKTPTYNFACVIDDALMGISHVLRGEDHISNTPKQIILYQALNFKPPHFAHLPLILDKEGGRLSKRTGATAVSEWRQMGYLPEALVNYLLLLGWSPGGNQEIIEMSSAIKKFEIKDINKTAAVFDIDKLRWINAQYIKKYDTEKLTDLLIPRLKEKGFIKEEDFNREEIFSVVKLFQTRISTLEEFLDFSDFVFLDDIKFQPDAEKKLFEKNLSREFELLIERFDAISDFNPEEIEKNFRQLVSDLGIKARDLVHPVRVALSGKTVGPGLFETIALLGKERTKERLRMAQRLWKSKTPGLKCLILFLITFIIGTASGCGTLKGMAEGAKEDWQTLKKWDEKIREHWW